MAHAVRLEPQGQVELMGGQDAVVVGAVVPGRSVGGTARLLDPLEVAVGLDVLAALEEQVLEEMGEARAAHRLVLRAGVVPNI